MSDLKTQCEKSFYRELYHPDGGKYALVQDTVSGRIYMRKTLAVFNTRVFAYLQQHPDPHIPRVHAFWEEDGELTVIEELISGFTLDYLLANELLDKAAKGDVVRQICEGLAFLHGANPPIIHRDLKTANVMLTDDGTVKIIDYDAAKVYDASEEKDTVLIGTKGSAAPEQYGFGKCDVRTDIYGVGIMIRDMFPEDEAMQRIAEKATQLDPKNRYQSVQDLARELPEWCFGKYAGGSGAISKRRGGVFGGEHSHSLSGKDFITTDSLPIEEISLPVGTKLHKFWPIPGFRSGKPWKMLAAILGYFFLSGIALSLNVTEPVADTVKNADLWLNRICFLGAELSLVDLFTDWSGIWHRMPLMTGGGKWVKCLGYFLCLTEIVCGWTFVCVLIERTVLMAIH